MNLNQKQAAELIGKSAGWLRQTDCPRSESGGYDAEDVAKWFIARETATYEELKETRANLETEALTARARKLQIENDLETGELLTQAEARQAGAFVAEPIRKASELLGRGSNFTGADASSVLRRACKDARRFIEKGFSKKEEEK